MSDERDEELDGILDVFRRENASERQVIQWQAAVREELAHTETTGIFRRRRAWAPIATAAAIGFCVGALTFAGLANYRSAGTDRASTEAESTVSYVYARAE